MRLRPTLLAIALLIAPPAAWAAETVHVIALRHRLADEVIPIARPLLRATEAMTGSGYQLFVRADAARVAEIERMVSVLDVAQRQLTITVQQARAQTDARTGDRVGGNVTIRRSGVDVDADYRGERRRDSVSESHRQMLRVLDGRRAFIRVGQSVPAVQRVLALTGRGHAVVTQGIVLQEMTTGFDVLPRVRGDNVILEITPRLTAPRAADDTFRFQELQTTVTARLGEWIDLGATAGQSSEVYRAILSSVRTQSETRGTVLLKVE
jgi:hypothetical protein